MQNAENIGLVRCLTNGNIDGFNERFDSFLNQCPSFLHSVGKNKFFPSFFLGMFATAFDSKIMKDGEMVYFRFDNEEPFDTNSERRDYANLKIAILTESADGSKVVRCVTMADRENSPGSRFSEQERKAVRSKLVNDNAVQEVQDLDFQEYKIYAHRENVGQDDELEDVRCIQPQNQFLNVHGNNIDFTEITRDERGRDIVQLISELANNDAGESNVSIRRLLEYAVDVHRKYGNDSLGFQNRESDYHGFLAGILMNFRYRHAAGVYLELFVGGGYSDITFLVRGPNNIKDSVPIVIELKANTVAASQLDRALEQAADYVERCPVSSVSIQTESESAVCVGMNFDLDEEQFQTATRNFLESSTSLLQKLFSGISDKAKSEIRDRMVYPAFGTPKIPDGRGTNSRIFTHTTGFAFGNACFSKGSLLQGRRKLTISKYLHRYDNSERMDTPTAREARADISGALVGNCVLTMVFHAGWKERGRENHRIVVFNILHDAAPDRFIFSNNCVNLYHLQGIADAQIYEINCRLRPGDRQNEDLGLTVDAQEFASIAGYSNGRQSFQGSLTPVFNTNDVRDAASVMMNTGWQATIENNQNPRVVNFFRELSNVLLCVTQEGKSHKWVVNRNNAQEMGIHSILHGILHACDNPARVIIEFQVGGEGQQHESKIDLMLLRRVSQHGGVHPTCIELKFADRAGVVTARLNQAEAQIIHYSQAGGFCRIADRNRDHQVAFSGAVFNNDSDDPNTLIQTVSIEPTNVDHTILGNLPPM